MSTNTDYRDETRLEHMLQALERILKESKSLTRDSLYFEDRTTRAIMFDFVVLGEAANNISRDYCTAVAKTCSGFAATRESHSARRIHLKGGGA